MSENALLRKQVEDANLDLDDARRSRRDLQLQLNSARQMMEQSTTDADSMRNRNPYIQVLIDGDGMIVSSISMSGILCVLVSRSTKHLQILYGRVVLQFSDIP